jgi:hypothetical protein
LRATIYFALEDHNVFVIAVSGLMRLHNKQSGGLSVAIQTSRQARQGINFEALSGRVGVYFQGCF